MHNHSQMHTVELIPPTHNMGKKDRQIYKVKERFCLYDLNNIGYIVNKLEINPIDKKSVQCTTKNICTRSNFA